MSSSYDCEGYGSDADCRESSSDDHSMYYHSCNGQVETDEDYQKSHSGNDSSSSSCYIATAVYGDIDAPQVIAIRDIRDRKLSKSCLGRGFINLYYSGFGKKAAVIIDKVPGSRYIARKTLDFVIDHFC